MVIVPGEAHTVLSEARVAVAAWVREDLQKSDDVVADLALRQWGVPLTQGP